VLPITLGSFYFKTIEDVLVGKSSSAFIDSINQQSDMRHVTSAQ